MKRVNVTIASASIAGCAWSTGSVWSTRTHGDRPDTKYVSNLILEGAARQVTGVANSPAAVTSKLRVRSRRSGLNNVRKRDEL
jgi:hypothetical protein